MRSLTKLSLVALGFVALAPMQQAVAQAFPSKPIKVVVPWPAGGSNDIAARIVVPAMAEDLKQPMSIENRGGATGVVGSEHFLKNSQPDGHTIMIHSATHLVNGHLYKKLPYDTMRDFAPAGLIAAQPSVLVIHPSLPVKTVRDLVNLAKSKPGQVGYVSAGQGSNPHMAMVLFESVTNTKLKHQPYRGGNQSTEGLVTGEAQVGFATVSTVLSHIKTNKLRPIAVTTSQRTSTLPDVPTMAQAGVPNFEMSAWIGLFAPAGTPAPVIQRLNESMNAAIKRDTVSKALVSNGLDGIGGGADRMASQLRSDWDRYGKLVKMTGVEVK